MVTCAKCTIAFHHKCVSSKSNSFTCTSCDLKTEGIRWSIKSDKIVNSCSVDNILTGLAIRCEKSPLFKKEVERLAKEEEDPMIKALGESTLAALDNDSWKAQSNWAEAVVNDKIAKHQIHERPKTLDMDGGTDEWFYLYTTELHKSLR